MDEVQLNTLYIMTEGAYLHLEGPTVVVEVDHQAAARVPLHMIDSVACFGRVMVSPQLMEECAERSIAISFLTANGRMMARVDAPCGGGVTLRRKQFRKADDPAFSLEVARAIVAGKVQNCRQNLLRSSRDAPEQPGAPALRTAAELLAGSVDSAGHCDNIESLRGIEGDAARVYFEHFALMTPDAAPELRFAKRSRQPPLDAVNALLSFFYSILTHDCTSALMAAGLDPSVGFFHEDRPGRPSLALDLVEEFRPFLADRFVITLINRKQVTPEDFLTRPGGAVELTDAARRRVLKAFQERKQERRVHPYLEQEAPIGRFAALQAKLLARHVRGDLNHYVAVLIK